MSESVEPTTVEMEESEGLQEKVEEERLQEDGQTKNGSTDSSSFEDKEIVENVKDDIRAQENTTDPNRTLDFPQVNEDVDKEVEQQIPEDAQDYYIEQGEEQKPHSQEKSPENSCSTSMLEHKIEDESMPSLVSSKIDESDLHCKMNEQKVIADTKKYSPKRDVKQDESDDDSVCVIDDDDDDEDDIGHGNQLEEDEEDSSTGEGYSSSNDGSDELERDNRYNNRYNKRKNVRTMDDEDDEDEDEEEDEDDEDENDEENDSEDGFGGGSDDLISRHSNGVTKHLKERSASLQDLCQSKEESPRKKRSVNPFNQKARYERNQAHIDHRQLERQHLQGQNKVQKYLENQSKVCFEQTQKMQQEIHGQRSFHDAQTYRSEEIVTSVENLKNFAEKTFKEIAESNENEMYISQSIENGEISIFPRPSVGNGEINVNQEEMEIDPIKVDVPQKVNGAVVIEDSHKSTSMKGGIIRRDECKKPLINGDTQINSVIDSPILSYNEYMSGSHKRQSNDNESEIEEITEKYHTNESQVASVCIDPITSNYCNKEVIMNFNDNKNQIPVTNQSKQLYRQENLEPLRIALDQRNAQFDGLRDAYQQTLSENLVMKMEIESLKKIIAQLKNQGNSEKKTVASQTELFTPALNMPVIGNNPSEQENIQKKFLHTDSLNSALTQWSDITGSVQNLSVPPHIDSSILCSDDSEIQTRLKQRNPFSRAAFMTSTKILQTLSRITKSKSDHSKSFIPEAEASTSTQNEEIAQTNSRKRKAAETSNSTKPFKIPHLAPNEKKRKRSSRSPESQPGDVNQEIDSAVSDIDADVEKKETENPESDLELGDDVKVFQFEDDNDGAKSFLIQANEHSLNSKPGVVRECGPYLLGNLEVYMTEKDGTINIWGKDLNSEISSQAKEIIETPSKSNRCKADANWQQSTPRGLGNQSQSNSTGKKSRTVPRFTQQHPSRHSCDPVLDYENCNLHNRLHPNPCSHNYYSRVNDAHCGCKRFCNAPSMDHPRYSLPNVYHHNCCNNYDSHHKSYSNRCSYTASDDEEETSETEENFKKSGHSKADDTLVATSSKTNSRNTGSSEPSYNNELDPLIRRPHSDQVIQKRRTGSKKVKGLLMNILKGCGDCRAPLDSTALPPSSSQEPNTFAQKGDDSPIQAANSSPPEKSSNNIEEIAAQLDAFRAEIERLKNQEDALRKLVRGSSDTMEQ